MKKIKLQKQTREKRLEQARERIQKIQRAKIEKKYEVKVAKLLELYADKTMGEFWVAADLLKEEMRKEFKAIGLE